MPAIAIGHVHAIQPHGADVANSAYATQIRTLKVASTHRE
jgi:hypothetical protein